MAKMFRLKSNPASPLLLILGGTIVAGGLGAAVYYGMKDEKKKDLPKKTPARKEPVFAENATLGNSPAIAAQVVYPITLGAFGPVELRLKGDVKAFDKVVIRSNDVNVSTGGQGGNIGRLAVSPKDAVKAIITDLSPQATVKAWNALQEDIRVDGGVIFDTPSYELDNVVRRVLSVIQPKTDWTKKTLNDLEARVWAGVVTLGEILYQSLWNAHEASQDQGSGGGGNNTPDQGGGEQPGLSLQPIVDQGWVNWYNKGDLKGKIAVKGEGKIGAPGSNFYAEMKVFEDDVARSTGMYTGVASWASPTQDSLIILYNKSIPELISKLNTALQGKLNS